MSRTSSSMLRPWRWARRRKRVFTAFSMFRTTSCAMVRLPCYRDYDITISHKIIRVKNAVPVDRIGCFRGTSNTLFAKCAKEGGVPGTLVDRFWHASAISAAGALLFFLFEEVVGGRVRGLVA